MAKGKILRSLYISMATVSLVVLGWSAYAVVNYFHTSPRYEVRAIVVLGLHRVSEDDVLARAEFEPGTNVFMADLDDIRERVEQLEWVRQAIVKRVLPNQIIIKVTERQPIGLSRMDGEVYQFDVDAMILDVDPIGTASFPIVDGLRRGDTTGNIEKVQTYEKVLEEVGETELSEIHINETGEVSLVSASDALLVSLGKEDFRSRWVKFLQLKPQIMQQYPGAVRVDLRFKNQVIVRMRDDDAGEKIVWDVEKRSL